MIRTLLTEKLGIKYPIVAGAMMHLSFPEYVAACSNAGGLGVLASAIFKTPDSFLDAVKETKKLTDKPFCVNINYFPALQPSDNHKYIEICAKEGVKIIETSGHKVPEEDIPFFREAGFTWIHKCAGVRYAQKADKLGADMITVVGWENGGATGKYDIGTMVLIPATVSAVSTPVIGGGGISDGRGLAAALCLGASGVILGTRLLLCKECPLHPAVKEELMKASIYDTTIVMRSIGATHRVWINQAAKKVLEIEAAKKGFEDIIDAAAGYRAKQLINEGKVDDGVISVGQGIGLYDDCPPVKDIFDQMAKEAEEILKNLNIQSAPA